MKTKTRPQRVLSLLLCMVIMLSLLPGGMSTVAYAAGCTHVHTGDCLSCDKTVHEHTDECYEAQLTCTQKEHTHGEDCYDAEGNLICELAEHTHTEDCYTKTLICATPEHAHTEECYQNCQHICGEECGVATNDGIMLMGSLGGTAPKLDGDWAYLTKFEILDDPTTSAVEGIMDGSGPFDTDTDPNSWTYKDRQGNDENDQNGKVRSFDTVTYKLNYATATSGEYDFVKEGWMNYEMVLPYASTRAVWQTDSMAWVGTKVADQAALDAIEEQTSGYYLATETRQGVSCQIIRGKFWIAPNDSNPYAIPGEGTLSAVVQVLAMEEGQTLKPSFSGWMEHNTTDQTTCGKHKRDEIISFTAPATTVTAEVRMDIQMGGGMMDGLNTYDFNTGNAATAPNYGKGSVTGRAEGYTIGVYLRNGDVNKGRKGLMAPASGDTLTFDLPLAACVTPTSGAEQRLEGTAYNPLVWALGSNDPNMDWRGRTTITDNIVNITLAANTEFIASQPHLRGDDACYNGGTWSYTVDPTDSNLIHVTVSGMQIDLTNFPHYNMSRHSYDTSGAIPISSGQLQLVQPVVVNGTHIMEDTSFTGSAMGSGTIWTSVKDNNMSYSYVSKTDGQTYTFDNGDQTSLSNDDAVVNFYAEKGSGNYYTYSLWSSKPTADGFQWIGTGLFDTTGGSYYTDKGGDPAVRTQSIGAFVGFFHRNDVPGDSGTTVAAKSFLKFDSAAVTPTGINTCYMNTLNRYQYKILYAAKSDGSAWASDDEMETTSMLSPTIQFYDSLSAITASGKQCVGVLVEYLPVDASYTGIEPALQEMFVNVGLTVNTNATEGALYQCTQEVLAWSRDAYEGANKSIPSLTNTKTIPTESWHWQPEYNKGYIDAKNGHLVDNTGGYQWGDAMQIICARSRITKEVAQQENGVNKSVFYMDSDQRFVDYKLNVSTEYVTYNVATTPTGVKTTLTVVDSLPKGLTYVPDSAYYGGTYVQNATSGRKGTVTGGIPLVPTITVVSEYLTLVTFEIPNVTIGEPLPSIYFTAKIGTRGVESTDVQDGESITNYALSRVGAEITSTDAYASMNAAGATIIISKNSATSRSKLADQTYIEKGDAFNWTINIGNNGGTAMPNALALDTLPYVNDGQGTTFTGTLSLSKWNVDVSSISNFSAANWKVMYTEDVNVRGTVSSQYLAADVRNGVESGPNHVAFKDITTLSGASINYTTGVVTLPANFRPTAMVVVGTLPGNQTMKIAAQMKIADGKQGDILVNQLDGYPSPIYVVKRSIEGCTWLDDNKDGIRQDAETMLPGVTATLLKLKEGGDATKEADYEVVKDENNAVVSVQTDKQKDAVTGTESNYNSGRYQFTNLVPGTYAVRFESGAASITAYTASPVNKGIDEAKDSDASPTYKTSPAADEGKLTQTLILGIVMNAANNSMNDINQVSRNNDSGLYLLPRALTVSKTVTGNMGDRDKNFDFTIALKDADGNNISGTYKCLSGIIDASGATAPAYTSITFKDGSATLQLKHGQKVTIQGLPDHCSYTVSETSASGYTTTHTGDESNSNLRADAAVAYTNNANATTPTGILLDIWPYALVALLAIGGAVTFLIVRKKKKRGDGRHGKSNQW